MLGPAQRLEEAQAQAAQDRARVGVVVWQLEQGLGEPIALVQDQALEQRLLGGKVAVEGALGDPGRLGDLAHARAVEPGG